MLTTAVAEQPIVDRASVEFEGLARRNTARAFRLAMDLVGHQQEAEDLVQEAFVKALEAWPRFRGDSAPDTWLFRIVVNTCLNHRRRRGLWKRIHGFLAGAGDSHRADETMGTVPRSPEAATSDRHAARKIREAVAQLPEGQRNAFVLRYLHDLPIKEVAKATGLAEGTVKAHLFRAVRALRAPLRELRET